MGASIVEAETTESAIRQAWLLGCNPGGEVLSHEAERIPPEKYMNRLLGRKDLEQMDEDVAAAYPEAERGFHNGSGQYIGRKLTQ